MKQVDFTLRSLSPLLMHSTAGMKVDGTGKKLRTKDDLVTGQEEAEQGAYRKDGFLVLPTIALRGALQGAAANRKVGKLTARKALAPTSFSEEFVVLVNPQTQEPLTDYEVDTRFVRIGQARVARSRAKVPEWEAAVTVEYDEEFINPSAIRSLFAIAGSMHGVGDYRPSTGGGPFGRFTVT